MNFLRKLSFILLANFTMLSSFGQLKDSTASVKWYQTKTFKTVALPAVLIGYGVSVMKDHGLFYSSYDGRRDMLKAFPNFDSNADDITEHTPTTLVYGLNLLGVKSKNNFASRVLICFMAYSIKSTVVSQLKKNTHIVRPDSSDNLSFPSGHTANAFVGAEFMHQEYIDKSPWISAGGYFIATATGALRMMNNKHWLSDVATGAGIGILSTRLAYLIYPWLKKQIIGSANAMLLPTYSNKTVGLAFSWSPRQEKKGHRFTD